MSYHDFGPRRFATAVFSQNSSIVFVGLAPNSNSSANSASSLLKLLASCTFAILHAHDSGRSSKFWRSRAIENDHRLHQLKSEIEHQRAEQQEIDTIAASLASSALDEIPRVLCRTLAAACGAEAWILAFRFGGEIEVNTNPGLRTEAIFDSHSALLQSMQRQDVISRPQKSSRAEVFNEERVFSELGLSSFICVPFSDGSLALASRSPIEKSPVTRVQTLARRLDPILKYWLASRRAQKLESLNHKLALRLFAAVDAERASMSRELHDEQAQLLTAAQMALRIGGVQGMRLLKRSQTELRAKIRALRPPALRRLSLRNAIAVQIGRLRAAGIVATLRLAGASARPSRPVQNVCLQVAAEAVSNVIKHSRATHANIMLELPRGLVRLSVEDNGRGIVGQRRKTGIGLHGLDERLQLLGGTLRLERAKGLTRLVCEIPEIPDVST
jgi:signal transduction histidine kinase